MERKKLRLNRQTLRDLTPDDLKKAAGGELTPYVRTLPLNDCIVIVLPTAGGECIPV